MNDIFLSGIYLYPVKSLRGIRVDSAMLSARGFQRDRRWMLVDKDFNFMSQRKYPLMSRVDVYLETDQIRLKAPEMKDISIPLEIEAGEEVTVKVWNDVVTVLKPGAHYDEWFSQFLDTPCHLVYMHEDCNRLVDGDYATSNHDIVSFADGFPFLLISDGSLQDLNQRLESRGVEAVDIIRFRPNLQVTGCSSYAEDIWNKIQIGDAIFNVVKPCSRCIIPTIDLKTGIYGKEPLKTLREYRSRDNKVYFGQNLIHAIENVSEMPVLQVGDPVHVIS